MVNSCEFSDAAKTANIHIIPMSGSDTTDNHKSVLKYDNGNVLFFISYLVNIIYTASHSRKTSKFKIKRDNSECFLFEVFLLAYIVVWEGILLLKFSTDL